jgi:hypothetical protein
METSPERIRITMDIRFHQPITAYALQIGGWFPLAFPSASVILVDRNVVDMAKKIAAGNKRHDVPANSWWFNLLNNNRYTLNPVLYAMEGRNKRLPSLQEFMDEFHEGSESLAVTFPKSGRVTFTKSQFNAVYSLVAEISERYYSERSFLLKIAPRLAAKVLERSLDGVEQFVLKSATDLHSGSSQFVVLVALSCLYESADGATPSIGRKLMKPHSSFSPADAHNVLSDLRALEFLLQSSRIAGQTAAFVTRDKFLTAFWCEVQPSDVKSTHPRLRFNVQLSQNLLPRLNEKQRNELAVRLRGTDF